MISKGSGKREAKVCAAMEFLSQTVFLEVHKRDIHAQTDIHGHTHDDSIKELQCIAFHLKMTIAQLLNISRHFNNLPGRRNYSWTR